MSKRRIDRLSECFHIKALSIRFLIWTSSGNSNHLLTAICVQSHSDVECDQTLGTQRNKDPPKTLTRSSLPNLLHKPSFYAVIFQLCGSRHFFTECFSMVHNRLFCSSKDLTKCWSAAKHQSWSANIAMLTAKVFLLCCLPEVRSEKEHHNGRNTSLQTLNILHSRIKVPFAAIFPIYFHKRGTKHR